MAPGKEPRSEQVESIRRSLVSLRRLFQRRELTSLWAAAFGRRSELDYLDLRLLDAVRVSGESTGAGGATIGDVSRLLGIDPSRASRQVAGAVRKGLLRRRVAQSDGRKVILEITGLGAKLQQKGSELTRSRIDLALDDWSAADRALLADLLSRFVTRLLPLSTPSSPNSYGRRISKNT
jgi:DNA-binding MarR family transcriptional regulator